MAYASGTRHEIALHVGKFYIHLVLNLKLTLTITHFCLNVY